LVLTVLGSHRICRAAVGAGPLIALLTACSPGGSAADPAGTPLSPLPEKTTIVAALGTTIKLKSSLGTDVPDPNLGPPEIEVTATDVVDPVKGTDDPVASPAPGDRLVAVKFSFTDRSVNAYRTAPDAATVIDEHGKSYEAKTALRLSVSPLLNSVNVPPHGTQAGYIPFEVPQGVSIVKARWALDLDTGQAGEWTLH
jgi:hypothetical protein